jgi:hypothetical protein
MKLPRKHIVKRDNVASIFLDLAHVHRVKASNMLSDEGELSDKLIMSLKNDIVNLTRLNSLTEEEAEEVVFNIDLINRLLDEHYGLLEHDEDVRFSFTTSPVISSREMFKFLRGVPRNSEGYEPN